MSTGVDVILLAGGRGSRMGGRDKATVTVHGRRLIDHCLATIDAYLPSARVCLVTTRAVQLPAGVVQARETPPFSGPVAAIAAGVTRLAADHPPHPTTLVLAVDAPHSARLYPQLAAALAENTQDEGDDGREVGVDKPAPRPGIDLTLVRSSDGHRQPLCALWRTESLTRAVAELSECAGAAVSALLSNQRIGEIPGDGSERDYDTLAALEDFPSD
ncbi:molybdopterin-guanine dinucleotide biosynthesis protein MobA [Corynebacterium ciconiae DSM 44920]|uniref:molybdenum cofactor guanylyltransferase n=1 Tax=Corynebacterium ciconiae TaxID=227319 RepID=UPI00036034A8|nr:NTP transferase domain-containing protein [Corynebacterium ciconiae]WKD60972.1 molybdopterin-guanine dinucleotide biosynthesis protein MobA [Corynebacterium ciconiae DSM 44920]